MNNIYLHVSISSPIKIKTIDDTIKNTANEIYAIFEESVQVQPDNRRNILDIVIETNNMTSSHIPYYFFDTSKYNILKIMSYLNNDDVIVWIYEYDNNIDINEIDIKSIFMNDNSKVLFIISEHNESKLIVDNYDINKMECIDIVNNSPRSRTLFGSKSLISKKLAKRLVLAKPFTTIVGMSYGVEGITKKNKSYLNELLSIGKYSKNLIYNQIKSSIYL